MRDFYTAIPFVVAIIKDSKGRILIGKQLEADDKPFPGMWDLPGGKVKNNETFEECLHREIKEETNLNVERETLFKVFHGFGDNLPDNAIPGVGVCYVVHVSGDFNPNPEEMDDMHFAEPAEIRDMELTPWTKYFLEEIISDQ